MKDSLISKNEVIQYNSVGMFLESESCTMENVRFEYNRVLSEDSTYGFGQRAIQILGTNGKINFTNCEFVDNWALFKTAYIYMNEAKNVIINNCIFKNTKPDVIDSSQISGGFLHVIGGSTCFINNT